MKKYLDLFELNHNKPLTGLRDLSRIAATEGIVLIKNEKVLPLKDKINVFGRIQTDYYKSGTGSGGLVNTLEKTSIIDALLENPRVMVNETLLNTYLDWQKDNPFNAGSGMWASEPWSQVEMPLTDDIIEKAKHFSEQAVIIIGRTAGEDKDNTPTKGSYYLSDSEIDMVKMVSENFKKVTIVLNVGNVIDMSFLDNYDIDACLYVWHGGEEGGRAVSDILTGIQNPSGKLPNTIAYHLEDYPSNDNFGGDDYNFYQEDIYVGYRYFETFKKEAVRYPFGFGLSYSTFEYQVKSYDLLKFQFEIEVKNTGPLPGKDVLMAFVSAPNGQLGKPAKVLVGFRKTARLEANESDVVTITFDKKDFASYDELGLTGFKNSYVLEKGTYTVYIGTDISNTIAHFEFSLYEDQLIEKLGEALRPIKPFKRLVAKETETGLSAVYEDTPLRTYDIKQRILENEPNEHFNTCTQKRDLKDFYDHKVSLDAFISQIPMNALAELVRGEGMSSPKVTPGTASAFGGVTETLQDFGFPIICCSDGPSGIRMDSGMPATSLPNGTLLASSFNESLVEALYYLVGLEMTNYKIDILLGPGMNIHRHPLCGRNFEYFSEDPFLTGHMAKSVVLGLQSAGVTGTLKHLAANNQEKRRFDADSIISERALREIYLKGFEIAVKGANAKAIMTSYNPINGIWAASNYDLNTTIVRKEWGFKGIIMTDWWAKMNEENTPGDKSNTRAMIKAQNDLYMVVQNAKDNSMNDNTIPSLDNKTLSVGELQRVAKNIAYFISDSLAFRNKHAIAYKPKTPHFFMPYLDGIKVNGKALENFNPLTGHYVVDAKNYFNVEAEAQKGLKVMVEKGFHTTLIVVSNGYEQNTYMVTNLIRKKQTDAFDYEKIALEKVVKVNEHPWGQTEINLSNPLHTNEHIHIKDGIVDFNKDGIISFGLNVAVYSKYIFELEIASNESNLAQIPFSILIGDEVKSTLTTNGTDGNYIKVVSQIVLNQGKFLCSIKALRTGLKIKRLVLVRHQ